MSTPEHTLDDLARATGFSKRQIRFYITKRLVPGAGDSRGPNATYGEETLRRLRLIGVLKDLRIEPTGRTMTLDEIGHSLDTLSAAGIEALLAGRAELAIRDTETNEVLGSPRFEPMPSRAMIREWRTFDREPSEALSFCHILPPIEEEPDPTTDIADLLHQLRDQLAELGSDTRFTQAGGHSLWRRLGTPEVEFHVRQPDTPADRARLQTMARALDRLLTREDDHDLDP